MAKPTEILQWAVTLTPETRTINGLLVTLPSRETLPLDFQSTGVLFGETLDRQYINQAFFLAGEWTKYVDGLYQIGHIHATTVNESVGTLATRFGGTWTARGNMAMGTAATVYIYERTA